MRCSLALIPLLLLLTAAKCPFNRTAAAPKAVALANVIPDSADQAIFGYRGVLNDQGILKGVLLSDTAYSYGDGERFDLHPVHLTFYTSEGAEDGVMVARAGSYNQKLGRLEAHGNVIVNREDGRKLTSPQLVFDQIRNQIFSDSAFTLIEPSKQLTGIGFESDPKLTEFRCFRACKGIAPVRVPTK